MNISIQNNSGAWLDIKRVKSVHVNIGGQKDEFIALSVLDSGEVVAIRHGSGYPVGGECVYSEIPEERAQ